MEANSTAGLFLVLGIMILASRLAGAAARWFDQPRVLGELIVGVILGPTLLNLLHAPMLGKGVHLEETIHALAELGVLLLMFKVGIEVHVSELSKVGKLAGIAGTLGAFVPIAVTVPIVMLAGYAWEPAVFAGVTLAATSVSISAQVLLELGILQTKEGNALLATALIDDVIAILLVSLVVAVTGSSQAVNLSELGLIVIRMAAYIAVACALAWWIVPRLMTWINSQPDLAQVYGIPAAGLIVALLFGWSAQYFGEVAAITGAFIGGLGISRAPAPVKHEVDRVISGIAYAFLVPIFFVNVGLQIDLSTFPMTALPLALIILAGAILSKVVGCGLGALLGGFNRSEALRLGVCMISRGEVGLIIASLGVSNAVFDPEKPLFAVLFLVILLTTVFTPPLVRRAFIQQLRTS